MTGSEGELSRLAREVGAAYFRSEPDGDGSCVVDHTASIMRVDPHGRLVVQANHAGAVDHERELVRVERGEESDTLELARNVLARTFHGRIVGTVRLQVRGS